MPILRKEAARKKLALKQKTLQTMLSQPGTFGIVSAYGGDQKRSKSDNKKRHGELLADLQKMGYRKVHDLKGQWEGVSEKALLIPNVKPDDLITLGKKYGQDAVIYKNPEGVLGMYNYKDGKVDVAVDPKGMPSLDLAEGKDLFSKDRNWSFTINFMWGHDIPWDGKKVLTKKDISHVVDVAKEQAGENVHTEKSKEKDTDWWDSQSDNFKKNYCQEHENSTYC
jgi:hypothetical protein